MVVSGGGRVVLEVVHVPCDSESNENKLEPRILLIFYQTEYKNTACVAWATTTIDMLIL